MKRFDSDGSNRIAYADFVSELMAVSRSPSPAAAPRPFASSSPARTGGYGPAASSRLDAVHLYRDSIPHSIRDSFDYPAASLYGPSRYRAGALIRTAPCGDNEMTPSPQCVHVVSAYSHYPCGAYRLSDGGSARAAEAERGLADLVARIAKQLSGRGRAAVEGVFKALDTNGSGRLSRRELSDGMSRLGYRLLDSELDAVFRRFDANRDGTVSMREFVDRIIATPTSAMPAAAGFVGGGGGLRGDTSSLSLYDSLDASSLGMPPQPTGSTRALAVPVAAERCAPTRSCALSSL